MKHLFGFIALIAITVVFTQVNSQLGFAKPESPEMEEEDKILEDSLKAIYRRELYFAAEGTNVDSIRYENWKQNYRLKQFKRTKISLRSGVESFAAGLIQATWHESK